jgi:hypothetical protein
VIGWDRSVEAEMVNPRRPLIVLADLLSRLPMTEGRRRVLVAHLLFASK